MNPWRSLRVFYHHWRAVGLEHHHDEQAMVSIRRLAELDDEWGLYDLALRFDQGRGVGMDADAARALYLRVFEKNGRFAALSAYGIGRLALVAEPPSLSVAAHWFKLAASGGHVESQYNYGLALIEGWTGEVDVATGLRWLERAREAGMAEADEIYQRVTRQLAEGLIDPAHER